MMEDITKTIMFTTNAIQGGTPTTIQYQTADGILKQPKIEGQKSGQQDFPTFCYTTNTNTVNLAQLADDNKTCYIAQPIGGYNYALVNQMQLAQNGTVAGTIATVDNQGRLQVVNKPITVNTISNISFKCDVCGLMFSHLTLLNHHKRIHNQDNGDSGQNEAITVVTNGQNIVQAQNLVTENGQPLGQIQIVATETLEPATTHAIQQAAVAAVQQHQHQQQQQQQQQQQVQEVVTTVTTSGHNTNSGGITTGTGSKTIDSKTKCMTCGHIMQASGKRKNAKLRCENCMNNENAVAMNSRAAATQIFVAPDGDVKFEMSELPTGTNDVEIDSLNGQNIIQISNIQQNNKSNNHQHIQQNTGATTKMNQSQNSSNTGNNNTQFAPGHHPVKRRNLATVTKCQKCNGSGVIFVGGAQKQIKPEQTKPFQCNICGGTFSRYSSLWSHKKLHSGEKNYKCSICGLAFAKAVYLKNHSRIHTGEKPYKCGTCGMQFSQSPHLKNHERTHSGEKPYVCEVCDKGFARHATLWNHRRIHTGEKPYKCEICGSAFSQAAHLKNHAKVHSGEKPFKCDICSAAFADRFALKRHRGIHEKYGQTAPRQQNQQTNQNDQDSDQQQISQMVVIQKQELPEIEDETEHTEVTICGF